MKAIILVNFGSPGEMSNILPFLTEVLKDVLPVPLKPLAPLLARTRLHFAKNMYKEIGGKSPVADWTQRQAALLERGLGGNLKAYSGMLYGSPSIKDAVMEAKRDGAAAITLLPLFPYRSKFIINSRSLCASKMLTGVTCNMRTWHLHPLYISAVVESVKKGIIASKGRKPFILFSAHAVPEREIKKGSPYLKEVGESVAKIMEHFEGFDHIVAFQSAGWIFKWTGPSVKSVIEKISAEDILFVPFGFACENAETLYEIDKVYVPLAKRFGKNVIRIPCLNDNQRFIEMLCEIAME